MNIENNLTNCHQPRSPLDSAIDIIVSDRLPDDVVARVSTRAKELQPTVTATVSPAHNCAEKRRRISRARLWTSGIVMLVNISVTCAVLIFDDGAYQAFAQAVQKAKAAVFLGETMPTPRELLDSWEQGCQAIQSYDIYIENHQETYVDVDKGYVLREIPLKSHTASHQIRSGEKRRLEFDIHMPNEAGPSVAVWDGKLSKLHVPAGNELTLEAKLNYTGMYIDYESLYRNLTGSMSFMSALRQRPELIVEGKENSSFILYTPPVGGNYEFSPFGFRVWLDSDKNFMPVRIQRLLDVSGEEVISQNDTTFKQIESGVWVPVESINLAFPPVPRRELPVVKPQRTVETVDLKRSRFNIDIPDSAFDLDIPNGTKMHDKISNTHYLFGKAVSDVAQYSELVVRGRGDIDKLTSFASEDMRPDPSTSRNPPVQRKMSRTLAWLVALNICAALIGAAILLIRRKSTKHI